MVALSWRAGIGGGGGEKSRRLDKRRGVKRGTSNWEGALEVGMNNVSHIFQNM